ncbi:MAG: cytochrome c biosis protein CcmG, thiol:disulfide interchange protein DsbE [Actinomycetota bacterium]|nr:cytochrome c biosis protein CcmG, thiol:disulfide interchange protein DsbE [Actinomycetota bacterium]
MTRIRWVTIAVSVFVLALGALLLSAVLRGQTQQHGSLVGKPAPAFNLKNIDGATPVTTAALQSRTIVVNFWNSWCTPCRQEHPALAEFYARHRGDPDFAMVGIVRDDDARAVRDYVTRENVKWTIAMDPNGAAAIAYGTNGQPETYVIGPDGRVAAELWGPANIGDLEQMLARAQGRA